MANGNNARAAAQRYVHAFGDIGASWYLKGISWDDAVIEYNKRREEEIRALKAENNALRFAGVDPVSSGSQGGSR